MPNWCEGTLKIRGDFDLLNEKERGAEFMWKEGIINGYLFYAKVYEGPSEYGIDKGRVSKLEISKGAANAYAGMTGAGTSCRKGKK